MTLAGSALRPLPLALLAAAALAAAGCEARVNDPAGPPAPPQMDSVVALDGALWVRWRQSPRANSYVVYRRPFLGSAAPAPVAETQDSSFLDFGVVNGTEYAYTVAALDEAGRSNGSGAEVRGIPRPDSTDVLIWAASSDSAHSAFTFPSGAIPAKVGAPSPATSHFRVTNDASGWHLVPIAPHAVVDAGPTTALVCAPGLPAGCTAVTRAPATGYAIAPVALQVGHSYVIRVMLLNGAVEYGAVRVTSLGTDVQGRAVMRFDWAWQLVPTDPRL
jgi:hypothetical protein